MILVISILVILLVIGYYVQDYSFHILAGMLAIIFAISIFNGTFFIIQNDFLRNGLTAIIAGLGMYYVIVPSINYFQEWNGGYDGR